jgi:hypothetical protein
MQFLKTFVSSIEPAGRSFRGVSSASSESRNEKRRKPKSHRKRVLSSPPAYGRQREFLFMKCFSIVAKL